MKTNPEGRNLIALFQDEYLPLESRTASEKAVTLYVTRRLNSNQFSALVCLVMSTGIEDFKTSKLLKYVNQSEESPEFLSMAIDRWRMEVYQLNEDLDRVLDPFLQSQRDFEIDLFLKPETVVKRKRTK